MNAATGTSGSLPATSVGFDRRNWALRGVAGAIALLCLANLSNSGWGQFAGCALCAQDELHLRLLGFGALAWGGLALSLPRWNAAWLSSALALLAGSHLGLVGTQLAEPRLCVLCLSAAVLALVALGVQLWRRPVGAGVWIAFPLATFLAPPLLLGLG